MKRRICKAKPMPHGCCSARKGMLAQPRYAGGTFEGGADAATVEDVVRWGSAGGAQILGLAQSGTLQVGMQADLAIYRLDDPRYFGLHDMAIGPVACGGRAAPSWKTTPFPVSTLTRCATTRWRPSVPSNSAPLFN